ncbi:MAG: protein TolQ [Candidatus Adiutrix sp.]
MSFISIIPVAQEATILDNSRAIAPTGLDTAVNPDILDMVLGAGPVVQGVMLVLLLFSLISWAIIITKAWQIKKAGRNSFLFLEYFWKSRSLSTLYTEAADFPASPIAQVFRVGYQELGRAHKARLEPRIAMENVQRSLRRATAAEGTHLFKNLPFLATCGNAAPFIGLFGTVWGIMGSFHEIGLAGSANLATVAPGISEALIATAAGLAAAIPAVVFFNYFNGRLRELEAEMSNFTADFVNVLERDLLKRLSGKSQTRPTQGQED